VRSRLREHDLAGEVAQLAVDARAHEALLGQPRELLLVLALAPAHDGREQRGARALAEREHARRHLLERLAADRRVAARAVRDADARPEQTQVVEQLGGGAHRRARATRDGGLLDRDRGREAVDRLDVGLRELVEELAGVGGERLDVAALALGVERVEGERGLAAAREARDDHEPVARDVHVDVAQVVDARAADANPAALGRGRAQDLGAAPPAPWKSSMLATVPLRSM
jgi:hypothetical protein